MTATATTRAAAPARVLVVAAPAAVGAGLAPACEVTPAATVREALAHLDRQRFDVVVLGLDRDGERDATPGPGGPPAASGGGVLRQLRSGASTPPIVAVSAAAGDEAVHAAALRDGAEEVVSPAECESRLFARLVMGIVERERARARQRQAERLLEASPDALLVTTSSGVVRYANRAAVGLFGKKRDEIVGQLAGFSVRAGEQAELRIPRPDEASGGDGSGGGDAGGGRVGELRAASLDWQGDPAFLVSIRDVTEQRKVDMQATVSDRVASMETLAADVAHGINNPLAAVMANLDLATGYIGGLAREVAIPEELQEELTDALEAAERVRQIVRDLRVFSRGEDASRGQVDVERVLDWTLRMAWNEIRPRARVVKSYGKVPPVMANESRLGQALLNLVVSAAQAIPEGNVEANEIRIATSVDGEGRVVISVADTGAGLPPYVQERLFSATAPTGGPGSGAPGMGLVTCHRIVTSFGGEVVVDSKAGHGTEARVLLPSVWSAAGAAAADAEAPVAAGAAGAAAAPGRRGRVLVIDDEAIVAQAVKRLLAPRHEVVAVAGARQGLELLARGERFDIVLCDLIMPDKTGMEFYGELRRADPALAERVVFMTGGAFIPGARGFLDSVPNERLDKPFSVQRLRAVVDSFVR